MDNEIKTWLYDILQSINLIESYYEAMIHTENKLYICGVVRNLAC